MVFHRRQDVAARHRNALRVFLCAMIMSVPLVSALAAGAEEEAEEFDAAVWDQPEAPELAALVEAGELPPLEERIPVNPYVAEPHEEIGRYGGQVRSALIGAGDAPWLGRTVGYEGIVLQDYDFETIIPSLASDYEVSEDGSEFTFTLREGLRWSDGEPLTTDDVAWTFENEIFHEDLTPVLPPAFRSPRTGEPAELEVIDDQTFRLKFDETYAFFFRWFAGWVPTPSHYAREYHEDFNADVHEDAQEAGFDDWLDYYDHHVIDAGYTNAALPTVTAWRIVEGGEYTGEHTRIRFERNPYYHRVDPEGNQLPYIDEWVFDMIEDSEVLLLQTVAGEIDLMMRHINTAENRPVLSDNMERGGYRFFDTISSNPVYTHIRANMTYEDEAWVEVVRNRDFRAGLSHAIDREEVSDIVFAGLAEPRQLAPRDVVPYYNEQFAYQHTEYDPELAKEYFEKAGLEQDAQGRWLNYEGDPIEILVDVNSADAERIAVMELVQTHWEDVGLTVDLNVIDRTLLDERRQTNRSQVYVWGGSGAFNVPARINNYLPVDQFFGPAVAWGAWYGDVPEVEPQEPPESVKDMLALWDEIQVTPAGEQQVAKLTQLMQMLADEFMSIGVTTGAPSFGIVSNRLARNFPDEIVDESQISTPAGAVDMSTLFFSE